MTNLFKDWEMDFPEEMKTPVQCRRFIPALRRHSAKDYPGEERPDAWNYPAGVAVGHQE